MESKEPFTDDHQGPRKPRAKRILFVVASVCVVAALSGAATLLADHVGDLFWSGADAIVVPETVQKRMPANEIRLSESDIHPDSVYGDFLTLRPHLIDTTSTNVIREFQQLIALYEVRQGKDDNFTLRVIDSRSGGLLELFELSDLRQQHADSALSWSYVDERRRLETTRLVRKHIELGTPREAITIKWGRRNQILQARAREITIIEHEVNLARFLGLSLLTSEIGSVETFNDDRAVSRVGARSRYQIMPSMLRELGVRHYALKTGTGRNIRVVEEWHPLIAMQAAFVVMKAYSNAMGHELPGLSAYHTGPFNVLRLYSRYLSEENDVYNAYSNVVMAYMWGLTRGYPQVAAATTFGPQSRGYVPSVVGALRATENVPIDTTQTLLVERVQLARGKDVFLSDLLDALTPLLSQDAWRTPSADSTDYLRFRRLNPHMNLPPTVRGPEVPPEGDVRLLARSGGTVVRFFLPLGSSTKLQKTGFDVFDGPMTFRYDRQPYKRQDDASDIQYEQLIQDASVFGFSDEGRRQLEEIYVEIQKRARAEPTSFFAQTQYHIIRLHRRVWRSKNLEGVMAAAEAARKRAPATQLPPLPILEKLGMRPITPVPSLD